MGEELSGGIGERIIGWTGITVLNLKISLLVKNILVGERIFLFVFNLIDMNVDIE
jgi:hypothetical protein